MTCRIMNGDRHTVVVNRGRRGDSAQRMAKLKDLATMTAG